MKRTIIATVLILTLARFECYAQKNFYAGEIQQNGVTKTGFISYNPKVNKQGVISFKENLSDQPITLTAREVEGFTIPRFNINAVSVPSLNKYDTLIFAELMIKGKASLAIDKNEYIVFLDGRYLNLTIPVDAKRLNALTETTSKKLIEIKEVGKVKNFLSGCDLQVDVPKLTESSLSKLITQYNACQLVPQTKIKSRKVYVETFAGFTHSIVLLDGSPDNEIDNVSFDPSYGFNLGLNLNFTSGSYLDRTILTAGLVLTENTFHGSSSFYSPGSDLTHKETYKIKMTRLRIPIMLKKYSSIAQKGFYFGGGVAPYFFAGFDANNTFVEVRDGEVVASGDSDFFSKQRPFGTVLSVITGYDFLLKNNMRLVVGGSFNHDPGFIARNERYKLRVLSYELNVGVRF